MAYKVVDIFKDLPRTNCAECGKPGCFQFATSVYVQGQPLADCPYLDEEKLAQMNGKLALTKKGDEGKVKEKSGQALEFLLEKLRTADFESLGKSSGAVYIKSPEEKLELDFFGQPYEVTKEEVKALSGDTPTVWVKILILIYLTSASGRPATDKWTAFRDLPNTTSKAKSFDECSASLANKYNGDIDLLKTACIDFNGVITDSESADVACLFTALPRVRIKLLFWDGEEGFEARASMLLDENVLEYLDQEAIVFMAEAFVRKLQGLTLEGLVP